MPPKKIRVLTFDDSASVREALDAIVGAAPDMQVMAAAADPCAAAQHIQHDVPNVILLDLEVPRMDGSRFCVS